MSRHIPAHIRAAIARNAHRWETTDGTPALEAMGIDPPRVCPECETTTCHRTRKNPYCSATVYKEGS